MKVALVSLGCARTLVDSEVALGGLKLDGYSVEQDVEKADVAVVNTCGFIEEAKAESIETILRLCALKKKGKISGVVVLGCLAQRYGEELRREIPEVDAVIGTNDYAGLAKLLEPLRKKEKVFRVEPKPRYLLDENTPRHRLTAPHLAYVKISEGCINACSYCVIPKMKGPHRSREISSILAEIETLSRDRRLSEVNLIGQDTAAFGYDRTRRFELPELLEAVDRQGLAAWVRLLYAHPGHVSSELVDAIAQGPRICKYVDFPVEHSHDAMLKRMNRGVDRQKMEWGLERLRRRIPDVAIRTTVIVGFPGETEEEFEDLMAFLQEWRFERLGAFMFSAEEGARAASMQGQIPDKVKKERYEAVMAMQQDISREALESWVGRKIRVLVEEKGPEKNIYYGRTERDAPEVDGQVILHSASPLAPGDFAEAEVTEALEYDLVAQAKAL